MIPRDHVTTRIAETRVETRSALRTVAHLEPPAANIVAALPFKGLTALNCFVSPWTPNNLLLSLFRG